MIQKKRRKSIHSRESRIFKNEITKFEPKQRLFFKKKTDPGLGNRNAIDTRFEI